MDVTAETLSHDASIVGRDQRVEGIYERTDGGMFPHLTGKVGGSLMRHIGGRSFWLDTEEITLCIYYVV